MIMEDYKERLIAEQKEFRTTGVDRTPIVS